MVKKFRIWLLIEGIIFLLAAFVHAGYLLSGYMHFQARVAESVIGIVLLIGLAMTCVLPNRFRALSLGVQIFALVGTLVGATMIAIGVGPQSLLDRIYHVGLIAMLLTGLIQIWRSPSHLAKPVPHRDLG